MDDITLTPSDEAVKFFRDYENRLVSVKGTGYKGIVVGLNERTDTAWLPNEFPIIVRITESKSTRFQDVIGQEFEYPLEFLKLEN